jgi:Immunity protein family (Imm11)
LYKGKKPPVRILFCFEVDAQGMGIWRILEDPNHYRSLTAPDLSPGEALDIGALFRTSGTLGVTWTPIRVELWENGDEEEKPIGHFPSLSALAPLAISAQALEALYPLMNGDVEALDLITEQPIGKFYALNIFFADCLDHSKSTFVFFNDGGIMGVERYAFRAGCLEGKHIFRLPEKWTYVFVDDAFKHAVEENELEGLNFYRVPQENDSAE